MTDEKSNGVLTTRKRSGQVKPSNSMPSARRTLLRAPSAPISQRPDSASRRSSRSTSISTPSADWRTSTISLSKRMSKLEWLPKRSSRMRVSFDCSACSR